MKAKINSIGMLFVLMAVTLVSFSSCSTQREGTRDTGYGKHTSTRICDDVHRNYVGYH